MSDEQNDPRPYDPEEFEDDVDEVTEDDQPGGDVDEETEEDELPDELPRSMPPGSAAELDEDPGRREPDDIEP